jgi:hypothetical protein
MSNYSETDFCKPEEGLDYIFGRMMAIFGATFSRHFDGIDACLVRQEWQKQLGSFLTYRPSMDFAIEKLDGEFVPSAIKFRNLCNAGPEIPRKPVVAIEKQLTQKEKDEIERNKKIALAKLAELRRQYKGEA